MGSNSSNMEKSHFMPIVMMQGKSWLLGATIRCGCCEFVLEQRHDKKRKEMFGGVGLLSLWSK